jgi:hypothetical protein
MFGGDSSLQALKRELPTDLLAAGCNYPDARTEAHREGYLFHASHPPVPKTKMTVKKSTIRHEAKKTEERACTPLTSLSIATVLRA